MQVSIIIVNYNTKQLLRQCVESIISKTENLIFEIIVVDNASIDGSQQMIEEEFSTVKLIALQTNLGFGKGNNIGVASAIGEYVFLLNSDIIMVENAIYDMYSFFNKNEKKLNIGVLGCRLIDENYGIMNSGGGFPKALNDIKEYYYVGMGKYLNIKFPPRDVYDFNKDYFEIDYVIGADMMLKKEIYLSLGGFDEAFFMYYEESDLQYRIRQLGLKCFILGHTKIIHLEGGSTKSNKPSDFKRTIVQISKNHYFKKNDKKFYFLHVCFDMMMNFVRIFDRNYTLRENMNFIIKNIKSY